VHWVQHLRASRRVNDNSGAWQLVFFPISIRFDTNRPEIFFEGIAARLSEITGRKLEPPLTSPAAHYRERCRELINEAVSANHRVLIIVDGLDEAVSDSFNAEWFPRGVGAQVRLLVSGRILVGDYDAQGWMRRLGWTFGVRCRSYYLETINREGVLNLLLEMGVPINQLTAEPEIVYKLHELSEGEPLLLGLYVEDLWQLGTVDKTLTIEDLKHLTPGFAAYFRD